MSFFFTDLIAGVHDLKSMQRHLSPCSVAKLRSQAHLVSQTRHGRLQISTTQVSDSLGRNNPLLAFLCCEGT